MSSLEEQFQQACEADIIPGVVLLASSADGKFQYQNAFGLKSPTENLTLDSTFLMASCTKLMTSVCMLQCVERGQIGLDDDVSAILTELQDVQVLEGFQDETGEPILKTAQHKITIRHLLTHSSGIGADNMSPKLARWRKYRGEKTGTKGRSMMESISTPLLFEPGTNWMYGASLDWAGLLIMRLNNLSLEAYMQKYLWDPLGIQNITFHNASRPDVRKNLVHMRKRGNGGIFDMPAGRTDEKVYWTDEVYHDGDDIDAFGGGGAFGSAVDYMKILLSLCADDGKLLMSETIDEMFSPQLNVEAQKTLSRVLSMLQRNKAKSELISNYGLGGLLNMKPDATGAKGGVLGWSGRPNLYWTIDRTEGLSLFYASNVVPAGDFESYKMRQLFEKEMYARILKT